MRLEAVSTYKYAHTERELSFSSVASVPGLALVPFPRVAISLTYTLGDFGSKQNFPLATRQYYAGLAGYRDV